MKSKRFRVVYSEGFISPSKIIIDTKTGVQYLFHLDGSGSSGLTPLLGPDGKPLVARRKGVKQD